MDPKSKADEDNCGYGTPSSTAPTSASNGEKINLDPFYLQSFEPNVYPRLAGGLDNDMDKMDNIQDLHYMGGMDSIDFINPQGLRDNSHAFPPTDFPQNTPSLGPKPHQQSLQSSHQQSSQSSQSQHQSSTEPSLSTPHPPPTSSHSNHPNPTSSHSNPLAMNMFQSPILPSQDQKSFNQEHLMQKQKQRRQKNTPLASPAVTPLEVHHSYSSQVYASNLHEFEPLTSPALKAQQANQLSERRRSSSTFNGDYTGGTPAKRRTPLSTPNMQAANSKPKRSPSLRKMHNFEPLPASSHDTPHVTSAETTPMLPPQGKKMVIEQPNFGPGLMSFTMNRLAEQQIPAAADDDLDDQKNRYDDQKSRYDEKSRYTTSSSETSPVIEANDEYGGRRDRPAVKKTSHKLAEQGRRNRMNQAVHELSGLIPREIREKVAIPSKATTVELASTYIRQLVEELASLKKSAVKQEDE